MSTTVQPKPKTAHNPHKLVLLWFFLSSLIVFWDAGYCLLRPRSFFGGDLHHFWNAVADEKIGQPYKLYATIDYVYGIKTFEDRDGFTSAQAILNLCENMMNFTYLYLWKVGHAGAPLVGLVSATCTFWKTILYWLMDQQCGWCQSGHNDLKTWITLFAIPNGFWIVVPFLIIVSFTSETTRRLAMLSKLKAE